MKIIEVNELIMKSIKENADAHFKVKSVMIGGYTLLTSGPVTIRVRLDNNLSLKTKNTVIINPETLEVVKV